MNTIQNLTKENFWDRVMQAYPNATAEFCKWIDDYKQSVVWDKLFSANEDTMQLHSSKYKYHEIPYAMQLGIWMQFVCQLHNEESYIESVFCDFGWHELDKIVEKWLELREETLTVF